MIDYTEQIKNYIKQEQSVQSKLPINEINKVINILENMRKEGRKIFICGNGGSAATASHYVCDFQKGISLNQEKKFDFECLNDNVPMMMAIANDISYDDIFILPLKNKLKAGDTLIGISASGNSENVARALQYANEIQANTIAICGYDGGKIKKIAKYNIHINCNNMQIIEDLHLMLEHLMVYVLCDKK